MTAVKLSIVDRLQFTALLPKNGKMIEMEIAKSLSEKVRLTAREIELFELKDLENGSISWNPKTAKDITINFEDSEIKVLQKGVDTLDAAEQITLQIFDLAKKIKSI
jgi:hypothetical protein